jgi:dihydroorotate dehydrogenase
LVKNRKSPAILDDFVPENGGMSGKVGQGPSDEQIRKVYTKFGKTKVIIGVGGVFTAEDAYRKIRAGASLIEMITGMLFQGPQVISEINRGLVELLKRDGFSNISQAIGTDA